MKELEIFTLEEAGLRLVFGITPQRRIRLLYFGTEAWEPSRDPNLCSSDPERWLEDGYLFSQIQLAGMNSPYEKQGTMYVATMPGCSLEYVSRSVEENERGRLLTIVQEDAAAGIRLTSFFQFFSGLPLVRMTHRAENTGADARVLTYLGSFSCLGWELGGESSADRKIRVHIPHNGWQKELSWRDYGLPDLGLAETQPHVMRRTSKTFELTNTGNWSSKHFLPMGLLENTEAGSVLFFQIEHNGSWHWEIGLQSNHYFLNISGPTCTQSDFAVRLASGESFTSVPVCVGAVRGGISEAVSGLVQYRRLIRRPNPDNEKLPVIFNDYMNCLFGDPTTEKELPLIEAARKAGCEYYVIDAGWYADGFWWDGVGEWKESRKRFPGGLRELTDIIRSRGMVPGLWLELEVMGIRCPLVPDLPKDWFFRRFGEPVYDRSRMQLDFRNPEVRAFADRIIDRLVREYGAGYIKMDYNIEPGVGTDEGAFTPGEGLYRHEQAYLNWLDGVFARYPDLVIENCSSGGMRMDYAMLSRYSIQSTSDQEDFVHYATIACNAPSGVNSEQSAVWSYPQRDSDDETTVYNMINAMTGRVHQSGHLAELEPSPLSLVREGLDLYRQMRKMIPASLPFWPLGFAHAEEPFACLVLRGGEECFLALWHQTRSREGLPRTISIPLSAMPEAARLLEPEIFYPRKESLREAVSHSWDPERGVLSVTFREAPCARLFRFPLRKKSLKG